ncbi:MAG: insulinase family protein [Acidobacteria bacterium]|nr:MAG: insulinase family protein [Acidobacteriota bacterium]
MNRREKWVSALAMTGSLLACALIAKGQATDWKQISIPPLHAFQPQQPRRVALPNGMVIFLQEDHELPLIRGFARIRGGSREERADKIGLVEIYGQAWRTGGTRTKTADELDDYLEARAARIETAGGLDSTTVSWDCLKENLDDVFTLFVDVLQHPEFREDKIDLAKKQVNTTIARRNDEPLGIVRREAAKLVYGATSPYARVPEYATVAAVTRDDLLNWHRTYAHPNNTILGVVGDFDLVAMEAKLRRAFAPWPKGPSAKKVAAAFAGPKPGFYFVGKDDVNQSNIRMVDLGTTKDNPDYYAIEVFNQIFGGSFTSRLLADIRTKKGLAYGVGGGVGTAYDHPGMFQIAMGTKSGTTATAIDALYEEIDGLEKNPASADELRKAKDAILNSFVFSFDSKEKVLVERMGYEFYGYPADFLERYRAGIDKVTQQDVGRVAHKYIHKERLAVLVVGKAKDFDRPLSSLGPVTTLDITIPAGELGKKAEAAVPSTASKTEGKALLAKVIEGLGGDAKVRSVRAIRKKGTLLTKTPQGSMSLEVEELVAFPDQLWQKMATPEGDMSVVVSHAAAFVRTPRGSQDLPASEKEEALNEVKREPLFVTQHADDPRYTFSVAGWRSRPLVYRSEQRSDLACLRPRRGEEWPCRTDHRLR